MNLPPITDGTLMICMVLAFAAGTIIGYAWKARTHEKEIDAILRIARRIDTAPKKERAPKDPPIKIKYGDGKVYGVRR